MGSIRSAIDDDIDNYTSDCRFLGVKPIASHGTLDCYGHHAMWVR